ncbi:MAG TPA: helicase-related protein, partial [Aggregatilineales bacterium]|nr:helicase-related protein [Aggregatilineales bacterium]
VAEGRVGREGNFLYDPARLTPEQIRERAALFNGAFPQLLDNNRVANRPVAQRINDRAQKLSEADDGRGRLVAAFAGTIGYLPIETLCTEPGDREILEMLLNEGMLKKFDNVIFDPLRISRGSVREGIHQQVIMPLRKQLLDLLNSRPGQTAPRVDLVEQFGTSVLNRVLESGEFASFSVPIPLGESTWIRLRESDPQAAFQVAVEAVQPKDEDWQHALDQCGTKVKPGAVDGPTLRDQVLARSYPMANAANRIGVRRETLEIAIEDGRVLAFVDPDGQTRVAVEELEGILIDPAWVESIAELEEIATRELATVLDKTPARVRQWLAKARLGGRKPRWGEIRGRWNLPSTLREFREIYRHNRESWNATRTEEKAERQREEREQRDLERTRREGERRQREELRARLLAAFPTWQHSGRAEQRVLLHVGPPNSGKTYEALEALVRAGSGWYLAPLRLLAYEIFDRLNQQGVRCNLLTGEEYIPVDGAVFTASTIEMFNPQDSGECVIIDEAQMLADPDRGWAWTRAMMEAQSPEIRVIGPPVARGLIEKLAGTAAIPLEIIEHRRLSPLEVADKPWPLEALPERTILVAFSRRMVLQLKTELERYRRKVSVVYGNLPPEVRRKQADRFADGQTEICVATDAVGMGLNLPADRVCFFEMEKFDGKNLRILTPSEVHQIGGRAGRYGLSTIGEVGTTNRRNLKLLRQLFATEPLILTHARVAPVVLDLEMIPGSLAHRFAQWAELQSIPDSLRGVVKPADIDERIALARLLTDAEVDQLGLESSVRLVNAPTREDSRPYWLECAHSILGERPMPLPPEAPFQIDNAHDLEEVEQSITCADIYLWLAHRPEFAYFAPDTEYIRTVRMEWSMSIDAALLRQLDTAPRCVNCQRPLPLGHRYPLCDNCFAHRNDYYW